MPLTEQERAAWHRAYQQAREQRRFHCAQPVTPAHPIQPRTPGQYRTLRAPKG